MLQNEVMFGPDDNIGLYMDNYGQAPSLLISVWDFRSQKTFFEPRTYHKKGVETCPVVLKRPRLI